jgi:hypothetical protein
MGYRRGAAGAISNDIAPTECSAAVLAIHDRRQDFKAPDAAHLTAALRSPPSPPMGLGSGHRSFDLDAMLPGDGCLFGVGPALNPGRRSSGGEQNA